MDASLLVSAALDREIHLFVGKIDGGFRIGTQLRELRLQPVNARGEFSLHGAQCRARSGRGAGIDQIGDGLGLRDVHLAVQECAFGEFAGPRPQAAEFQQALEHEIEDERAAMALQLEDGLTGVGSGRRKVQRQSPIDGLTLCADEARQARLARRRQEPKDLPGNPRHL